MMGSPRHAQVAWHHRIVSGSADGAEASPLAITSSWAQRLAPRFKLDWATFLAVLLAVLVVLAVLAVFANSTAMLTRISIGLLIALALDPVVDIIERRVRVRRGFAVAMTAVVVLGLAGLLIAVLAPRAVAEAQQFSEQFPETVGQLERLPLVGDWIGEQNLVERAQRWVDQLPEQFTDERLGESAKSLVSGVVGVAIVAVFAIAVLVDGENLVARFRRLLKPERREQADEVGRVVYATLGRYIGGSLTVALLMGIFVLTVGLILGVPLAPLAAVWAMITDLIPQVGGALGGVVFVALGADRERADGAHRRRPVRHLHDVREPRHPAGDRRPVGRPDAADDDGGGVRRWRRRRRARRAARHSARRCRQAADPRGPTVVARRCRCHPRTSRTDEE